jgi:hypothetical protein
MREAAPNGLCIFNPAQLGALKVTGTAQLGIGTGTPLTANRVRGELPDGRRWTGHWTGLVLGLPLGWWRRRKGRRGCGSHLLLLIWVGITVMNGVSGCASSGESGTELNPAGGTPTGSYAVTVTASSAGVAHSLVVTLVVN